MKICKAIVKVFFLLLAVNLGVLKPTLAQEQSTGTSLQEINQSTRQELEKAVNESNSIQDAIAEQKSNLAGQIREKLPQREIQQVREIYDTIDTIIDFFGGLSFDDFFGKISLEDILDEVFGNLGISNSSAESTISDGSSNAGANSSNSDSFPVKTGDIGLPDSKEVTDYIKAKKTNTAEELLGAKTGGSGSVVIKDDLRTLYQISLAKETADASAFSDMAQEKLKKKSEVATSALKGSSELAQDSEEQDVTQNIMRNVSTQMWRLQQTNSILALNAQTEQRDDAIANTLMAESLRELNGERVAKNRELSSAYSAVITRGAQFTLPGLTVRR